jgi:hypothetical protein
VRDSCVNAAPGDRDAQAVPKGPPLPGDPPGLARWIARARAAEARARAAGHEAPSDDRVPEDWPPERPP